MRRWRGIRGRRLKRSVNWTPGVTDFNTTGPAQARICTWAAIAAGSNTYFFLSGILGDADLAQHGGEDAVVTRIRGRLRFWNSRFTVASPVQGTCFVRTLVVMLQITEAGAAFMPDYTTSDGLGRDEVMWSKDHLISGPVLAATDSAQNCDAGWIDIDVKAKRRCQNRYYPVLVHQTVAPGMGAANVPVDFVRAGGIRTLLMRPR